MQTASQGAVLQFQHLRRFEDRAFDARRVALYGSALLACYVVFMAKGYYEGLWLIDTDGSGKAIDFVAMWAAARLALAGQAATAYDLAAFTREQLTGVGKLSADYAWAYPPTYFLAIAPLAFFSYPAAALIWLFGTLAAYAAAVRAILPCWPAVLAALASPFVLWNFHAGQNGFLVAALIGGALALLDRAPIVAGVLLGLLSLKPQLGLLFPLVLLLTGRRRAFAAAAATSLLLAALSYLIFGQETWRGFFEALQRQAGLVLDRGDVAFHKQQSVYALVRLLGGGDALAWSLHGAVALAACAFTCWVWLRPVDYRLKAASLAAASLIATPYLFIYDLPILSVPLVFLASMGVVHGFVPGERTAVALLAPVLLLFPGQPVGVPLLALLMLLIALRLRPAARTLS
jgi:arabinofuranan 3-O-arabinosyltransferase